MAQKEHTKAGQHASGRFFLDDINLSKLKLRGQGLALVSVDFFYFFLKKRHFEMVTQPVLEIFSTSDFTDGN